MKHEVKVFDKTSQKKSCELRALKTAGESLTFYTKIWKATDDEQKYRKWSKFHSAVLVCRSLRAKRISFTLTTAVS